MLNSLLHDPHSANLALGYGWVILLPKAAWVDQASGFRPIICGEIGEVFARRAARLATLRVTHLWPVRDCCFGSVKQSGLSEALRIVKHAAQESAGLEDTTLLSLFINSLLRYMVDHWSPSTARSSALLRWFFTHSHLRFQLFDCVWWCSQRRGAQQGEATVRLSLDV